DPRRTVAHGGGELRGGAVGLAGQSGNPRIGRAHVIEAGFLTERAALAGERNGAHDQTPAQVVVAEAHAFHHPRPKSLNYDIALCHKCLDQFAPACLLDVDTQAFLRMVVLKGVGALRGVPQSWITRSVAGAAAAVAGRGELHLDHLGTELCHDSGAGRAGNELRDVKHAIASQHGSSAHAADAFAKARPACVRRCSRSGMRSCPQNGSMQKTKNGTPKTWSAAASS